MSLMDESGRLKPKSKCQKKKHRRIKTEWKVSLKPDSRSARLRASRLERYAARGQLRSGVFYCKAGLPITEARVLSYSDLCHHMIHRNVPAGVLNEAALAYEDLVNRCRLEVFLALLDGYDPLRFMPKKRRTKAQHTLELRKLEFTIVKGRLLGFFRRENWRYHPDQRGGCTWSLDQILAEGGNSREARAKSVTATSQGGGMIEIRYGLFHRPTVDPLVPLDFVEEHKDTLLNRLETEGPKAVKDAFWALKPEVREALQQALFEDAAYGQTATMDWGST